MDFEVLAEGLRFPEGPVAMADGSVVLVEIERGTLTRVWDGRSEVIAELGGGPNGAAIGPDGACYVCNNGGGVVAGGAPPEPGRIERVDLSTGRFERLYEKVGDELLSAPNDLVFDREGNIWFTDLGKTRGRTKDLSGVYYASSDGASITEISFGATGYNGIGLSPDEKTVYAAETYTGRLIAFDLEAPGKVVKGGRGGRVVGAGPGRTLYDSLALQANGDVCIASIRDGITVMRPDGEIRILPIDDRITTNICFGGDDMRDAYITLSGSGRLIHARWPEPGLKLNFNA
ncbi:MAG: SMP-30/gluconolactonase/LRE family protein [Pseudomonadales bacterium]|jgi:gluconolactonase